MSLKINKFILIASSFLLLTGCGNSTPTNKVHKEFFKDIALELEEGVEEEKLYYTFYDKEDNRFNVELYYDLHFGLALKIEEYDLWNQLFSPNGGQVSEDYESITFVNSAYEKSELFSRGTYTLTHSVSNNKDNFTLTAVDKTYSLTLDKKEDPHYIDKDLVGEFEYLVNEELKFSLNVEVGEKADKYPVTISLKEGEKDFSGENVRNNGTTTTFDIKGNSDGQYIKSANNVTLTYSEGNETYTLKINNNSYLLNKKEGSQDIPEGNYFTDNVGKIKIVSTDFEVKVSSASSNNETIFLIFKELVADGNSNFWCWFEVNADDSITNMQAITSSKNKVFTGHEKYVFKHKVVNNVDLIDLYFDDVLTYQNLTVEEVVE